MWFLNAELIVTVSNYVFTITIMYAYSRLYSLLKM